MYTDTSNEDLLHIRVQKRSQLEDQLDKAVNILAERAPLCGGKGILVARHSPPGLHRPAPPGYPVWNHPGKAGMVTRDGNSLPWKP